MYELKRAGLLLVVVMILVSAGLFIYSKNEQANEEAFHAVQNFSELQSLTLQRQGVARLEFIKQPQGWAMQSPYQMPADAQMLERLVNLTNLPAVDRYPLTDVPSLAVLGLDPAKVVLQMDQRTVSIGGTEPLRSLRYVQEGDQLFLLQDKFSALLHARTEDFISLLILQEEQSLSMVEIQGKPVADQVQAVSGWQALRAVSVSPGSVQDGLAIRLHLATAEVIDFTLSEKKNGWILFRHEPPLAYHFTAATPAFLNESVE